MWFSSYFWFDKHHSVMQCFYTAIHCYLDNGQAGTMAAHTTMERYQNKAINESIRYAEYKDVNDYLIGRKSIIPHKCIKR